MPESLFAHRPIPKRRLFAMLVGSLLVHATLVGVAALRPTLRSYEIPPDVTELDVDTQLGETVQELIVPDVPTPAPEPTPEPTPPMPEATPPPPEPTPPPEEPEMPEPTPEAKPTPPPKPKPKPVAAKPASTPPPANVKKGPAPQAGVVGGVTTAEKTVGTPGGSKISTTGWKTPKPPYPYQARASRLTGSGSIRVSTDGSGRVISATVTQSVGSSILDSNTVSFAKANWHGPPSSTTTVPITYRLQ